jgi:hypothetical protein
MKVNYIRKAIGETTSPANGDFVMHTQSTTLSVTMKDHGNRTNRRFLVVLAKYLERKSRASADRRDRNPMGAEGDKGWGEGGEGREMERKENASVALESICGSPRGFGTTV